MPNSILKFIFYNRATYHLLNSVLNILNMEKGKLTS